MRPKTNNVLLVCIKLVKRLISEDKWKPVVNERYYGLQQVLLKKM